MGRGLNKIMIIGYLGRDPEMRFSPTGKSVANFSIACDRSWNSQDGEEHTETEWFNIIAWDSLAEMSKKYLKKGSHTYIEGRLQSRSWQDSDGIQHKTIEIVARDILLLSDKQPIRDTDDPEELNEYPF